MTERSRSGPATLSKGAANWRWTTAWSRRVTAGADMRGADPRSVPRRRGIRRARRRADLLGALRRRRADRAAAADVVGRALALVEAADPVPRAALPGGRRSTAAATAAPTGRPAPRRTAPTSSPPTRSRSWTPPATERATLVSLSCGALWATILAADHPERVDGIVYIGPAVAAGARPSRARRPVRRAARHRRGVGEVQHATTGSAITGASSSSSSPKCFNEPHSTKQIEDGVGWALETTPETLADATRGIAVPRDEDFARDVRAGQVPGARDPRRPR